MLEAAGISQPRALAVVYTARARLVSTVHSLREHFPTVSLSAAAPLVTAHGAHAFTCARCLGVKSCEVTLHAIFCLLLALGQHTSVHKQYHSKAQTHSSYSEVGYSAVASSCSIASVAHQVSYQVKSVKLLSTAAGSDICARTGPATRSRAQSCRR